MLETLWRQLINRLPARREAYLGKGKKPGDHHYRAYVGPPQDYDFIAAMTFNLATTVGLRQHHRLLDIGCGSLRLPAARAAFHPLSQCRELRGHRAQCLAA